MSSNGPVTRPKIQEEAVLPDDHSSIRSSREAAASAGSQSLRMFRWARPSFQSCILSDLPQRTLTRLLEIRRFGDIFSLNNGLPLKLAILLENTLEVFGVTSFISLRSVPHPPPPPPTPNTHTFLVHPLSSVPGTRETRVSKVRVGGASGPAASSPQGITVSGKKT